MAKEIVLPLGRFARVRVITWSDFVRSHDENFHRWVMKLASLVVAIDGEMLSLDAAAEMPLSDAAPLIMLVTAELAEAMRSRAVS